MFGLAPGNILQLMHLKSRLKNKGYKSFYELGSGNGYVSKTLLNLGMKGKGFDLNESACIRNSHYNKTHIDSGSYEISNESFFDAKLEAKVDIIVSSMVIEHLEEDLVDTYITTCKKLLKDGGKIITFVPAGMQYWSIEDDIAGHLRRYSIDDVEKLAKKHSMSLISVSGLTCPVSNFLLPISNFLIKKNESNKLELSELDRTILSGNREVMYKTDFPVWMKVVLNPIIMFPFYLLQKLCSKNKRSMVLYFEIS